MAHNFKWQRRAWFKQHPYCYYCKVRLTLPKYTHRDGPALPTDATIEHLRPRGHPERREPNPFRLWRRVLCCNACNDKKNAEFWRSRSLEEVWKKNGHWPRMAYQSGALPGEVA